MQNPYISRPSTPPGPRRGLNFFDAMVEGPGVARALSRSHKARMIEKRGAQLSELCRRAAVLSL
eukprot:5476357-Alexandrium_andersonii.AAC.1